MNWEFEKINREISFEHIQRKIADQLPYKELLFWRLSLLHFNYERLDVPKFLIRGHHLRFYKQLITGQTPYQLVESIGSGINQYGMDMEWYMEDTSGPSPRDKFIHHTLLQTTFEDYLLLKKDTPVEIVTTFDHICFTCKIGEHCQFPDPIWRREDGEYIWKVFQEIQRHDCDGNTILSIIPIEILEYQGVRPSAILELTTTKGTLDMALSCIHDFGVIMSREEWEKSVQAMKNNSKIVVNPQTFVWDTEEGVFKPK